MMRLGFTIALALLMSTGCSGGIGSDPADDPCPAGEDGCECHVDETCDYGLVCSFGECTPSPSPVTRDMGGFEPPPRDMGSDDDAGSVITEPDVGEEAAPGRPIAAVRSSVPSNLQREENGDGTATETWEIGFELVVLDENAVSVPTVRGEDVIPESFVADDGAVFEWGQQVTCDHSVFTNPSRSVSVGLVMDQSGSILQTDPEDLRISGAIEFLNSLTPPDELMLSTFASDNSCTEFDVALWGDGFTTDYQRYVATLESLDGCESGRTPLYDAMAAMIQEVSNNASQEARSLVVFTDGADTASTTTESQVVAMAQEAGVRIFTIGLSQSVSIDVLSRIADGTGGAFFFAADIHGMITAFRGMNTLLTGDYDVHGCRDSLSITRPSDVRTDYMWSGIEVTSPPTSSAFGVIFVDF